MVDIRGPSVIVDPPPRNLFKEFGIPVAITLLATGVIGAFGGLTAVPNLIQTSATQSTVIEQLKQQVADLRTATTRSDLEIQDLRRQNDAIRHETADLRTREDHIDEQSKLADQAQSHATDGVGSSLNGLSARVDGLIDRQNSTANALNQLRGQIFDLRPRGGAQQQSAEPDINPQGWDKPQKLVPHAPRMLDASVQPLLR